MVSNGNGRGKVIDTLIHNLTEGRASREFDPSRIEQGLRDLKIELREDKGCYWGYLRADDGEERWVSWGEIEDNLRMFFGLYPEPIISGEAEVVVPRTKVVVSETNEGGIEGRVAVPMDVDTDLPAIGDATPLLLRHRSEPKPADELPLDTFIDKKEKVLEEKINRYSILLKILGVGVAAAVAMGLGAVAGYFVRDFYARNAPKPEIVCPAAEAKDCPEADKLTEKNKTLADKLDKIQTKVKQSDANNKYLAERKINAENDYVECMFSSADQRLAFAESNSVLEQCNSASKQGREDYARLERRLEESSRESKAKTDFLVNQSSSWYSGFSAAVTLWLDAEERYVNSLEAEKICEISWESERQEHQNHSREWSYLYDEKEKADQVISAREAELKEYAYERSSFINSWDNEQSVALTYVDNGLIALAERDETVLELGDHLAEAQAVFDQTEACELREKEKEEQLSICVEEKEGWVKKYVGSQAEISGLEQKLILAKESLENKVGDYSALESSSKQEVDRKQEELAQLQEQLARVQGQLQIAEENTYGQKEDRSGSDLVECRREQELIQKESSRISGLLEEKTSEYKSLVDSFDGERKEVQKQLAQVEEQLGEEKKKSQGYLVVKDRTAQEYNRCADERDDYRAKTENLDSRLETCLDEREQALAAQIKTQNFLDACTASVDENRGGYSAEVETSSTLPKLDKTSYPPTAPKITILTRLREIDTDLRGRRPIEKYLPQAVKSDVPLRDAQSYYGQLLADPTRAGEIALAYVEEHGGSVTVCGKSNRDKAVSLYEQIAPEGRDDVYTLEFFVKGTNEFYQVMDAKTPYCVPLTVIEE